MGMTKAFTASLLAAVSVAKGTQSPVHFLQQQQEICRRQPPNISFEWDDHDVWGWWYDVQAEYAASDADFYALFLRW